MDKMEGPSWSKDHFRHTRYVITGTRQKYNITAEYKDNNATAFSFSTLFSPQRGALALTILTSETWKSADGHGCVWRTKI